MHVASLLSIMVNKQNILFYDGRCGLCQGSVKWLLNHESKDAQNLKPLFFASLDSVWAGNLPDGLPDSIVYLEGDRLYTKSAAVFKLSQRLAYPWKIVFWFRFLPAFITDLIYDVVARLRKWTRTQTQLCDTIKPEWKARLLV